MNNELKIKKLAIEAAKSDKIPADIGEFVLNYLGKQELKVFLRFYKNELDKKRIYVSSPSALSSASMTSLKNIYKQKDIIVDIDPTLGAGLKIQQNDTIVDFTFKKYINETIDELKD